jgi:hypothetical protein
VANDIKEIMKDKVMVGIDGISRNILDHFKEDDFCVGDDGNVFVYNAALNRIVRSLFLINEHSVAVIQPPQKTNEWCATILASYVIFTNTENPAPFKISAVADCKTTNAFKGYDKYTTAVASTRASSRALRDILGLDICTVEEVKDLNPKKTKDVIDQNGPIDDKQKMLIEKKFMNEHTIDDISKIIERKVDSLDSLTQSEALKVIKTMSKFRRKK